MYTIYIYIYLSILYVYTRKDITPKYIHACIHVFTIYVYTQRNYSGSLLQGRDTHVLELLGAS